MKHMILIVGLSLMGSAGCGHASEYNESVPALALLAESLATQSQSAEHVLRYNPALCNCPPWELLRAGSWIRVVILTPDWTGKEREDWLLRGKKESSLLTAGTLSPDPIQWDENLLCAELTLVVRSDGSEALP